MDEFLRRHAPAPPIPAFEPMRRARKAVTAAVVALLAVDDAVLDKPWPWRAGETEIRYGFYRSYEMFEEAAGEAQRKLAIAGVLPAAAQPAVGAATAARWDLHGLLGPLRDDDLDRDPGGGEWTLRQTLAHVINSQRAYGWFTAWWLARRDAPADDFPAVVPEDVRGDFPEETSEGEGDLAAIRERLDRVLDDGASVLGGMEEPELRVRARWSGAAVDVGFRLGRWSSHLREHTIQVEKTLAFLGRSPREVDRLVRLVLAAYGRLEATVFALPPALAAPATGAFERVTRELQDVPGELSVAAEIAHSRSNR